MNYPANSLARVCQLAATLAAASLSCQQAAPVDPIAFSVPGGPGSETLPLAARQAQVEILFEEAVVASLVTHPIDGLFAPLDAFRAMTQATPCKVVPVSGGQAYAIIRRQSDSGSDRSPSPDAIEQTHPNQLTEMQKQKAELKALFQAAIAAMAAATPGAAQTETEDQEIFELSPFVIQASENRGYRATSTLAGTRVKTSLKDVAAAISVVTEEFLEDTASTDLEDLLVFTTNTEVNGLGGNFSDVDPGGTFVDFNGVTSSIQRGTRIRGLASATRSREFFQTSIPFDAYNAQSVTINRGPNATLFGQGSPGGIIDTTLRNPAFADTNEIGLRIGSWGTYRGTFDVNRELAEDRIALRVAGLYQDEQFEQEEAFREDKRIYAAMTAKLTEKTIFRAHVEDIAIDSNNPRLDPPRDHISLWFTDPARGMPRPTHDASTEWNDRSRTDLQVAPGDWFRQPALFYTDVDSPTLGDDLRQGQVQRNFNDGTFLRHAGMPSLRVYAQRNPDQFPHADFYLDNQIIDESIFPYRDHMLDGPNKGEFLDGQVYKLGFEQRGLDDNIGIEVVYRKEETDAGFDRLLNTRRSYAINFDQNTHLFDGSPNPHFGRPFISGAGFVNESGNDSEDFRVTAFGILDFPEIMADSKLSAALGSHTLTAFYNQHESESYNYNFDAGRSGEEHATLERTGVGDPNAGTRALRFFQYLGPSVADRSSLSGANIPSVQAKRQIPSSANAYWFDPDSKTFINTPFSLFSYQNDRSFVYDGGLLSSNAIDSYSGILQSRWLADTLVTTIGWRRDESEAFRANDPTLDVFELPEDPFQVFGKEIWNYSAVLHAPKFIKDRLPQGMDISLHYNENENFIPSAQRINIHGEPVSPPEGITQDYGATLSFMENKLIARINFYEIKSANASAPNVIGAMNSIVNAYGRKLVADDLGFNDDKPEAQAAFIPVPQDILDLYEFSLPRPATSLADIDFDVPVGLTATTETISEGTEIEITFNPTENWRILFNAARQEAMRDNTAPALREVIEPLIANYTGPAATLDDEDTPIEVNNLGTFVTRNSKIPYETTIRQDGGVVHELREWRWNVITNYQFGENGPGWLRNVGIGGAVRWQDEVAIGFPVIDDPELSEIRDVNSPFFADSDTQIDLWASYQRKIFSDSVDWKLQLNLRNVGDDGDLVPVATQPDGSIAAYRITNPMTWSLQSTFEF